MSDQQDIEWMQLALSQARLAASVGEVPVGSVLVREGELIASAHNQCVSQHDPSAHAEIQVLRQAAASLKNYRLVNTTLYVTLEPCVMCLGALFHARVARLVYAAADPKTGAVDSVLSLGADHRLNHHLSIESGICSEQSADLLRAFFRSRRAG